MSGVVLPPGWRVEPLAKSHDRKKFHSGQPDVDHWFRATAFQSQRKKLTVTKVLLDDTDDVIGYYTLATSQVDFSDLPNDLTDKLPRRMLPVAVLAWLGIDHRCQGQGIGTRLLAAALRDCYAASQTFAFIAVILDCVDESAKAFYQRFDFRELPGYPMRLFLSAALLEKMIGERGT